jgi:hypothetical protein
MSTPAAFPDFATFYPFYLREHSNRTNRRLHFVGSTLVLLYLAFVLTTGRWSWLLALPVVMYLLPWIGHFYFEKNKPATFRHPLWSLRGDFHMYADILKGRIPL